MRNIIAISFLFVFVVSLLKPLFPYIDYTINKDYIAKNLCENIDKPVLKCDGKCHLRKQIKKVTQEESDTSVPVPSSKKQVEVQLFFHDFAFLESSYNEDVTLKHAIFVSPYFSKTYKEITTPPPQQLLS